MSNRVQGLTQHRLKHYCIPKPDRDDAEPLLHEPRVFAEENNGDEAAQWEYAKDEVDGFVFARAVHEPAVVSDIMKSSAIGTGVQGNMAYPENKEPRPMARLSGSKCRPSRNQSHQRTQPMPVRWSSTCNGGAI